MKYSTALTMLLAFGPATSVLAAPLAQAPGSEMTAGPAPEEHPNAGAPPAGGHPAPAPHSGAAPAGHPAPAPAGSSSQGMSGMSSGNEGVLDKVEKILKDVLGGLRKRGIVSEVGDVAKKTLDSTSKLLNGEKSGSQSSYSTQSTDPDAFPPGPPSAGSSGSIDGAAAPASSSDDSSSGSGSGSQLSQLLGGRSLGDDLNTEPINTSGATAPISNGALEEPKPAFPHSAHPSAPVTKQSAPVAVAPLGGETQNMEDDKTENDGPSNGTPTTDAFKLTPEEIQALTALLASQSQGQGEGAGAGIPGLNDD